MKRSGLLRRSRLSPVSKKRAKQNREYTKVRAAFLVAHPICQICETKKATDIHHKDSRVGEMLNDATKFMALCRICHRFIHEHPGLARARGWLT